MDRTSSSTQGAIPFSFEALPNEIHNLILNEIQDGNGLAGRPTLRSVSCVNQRLNSLAMPFLMECYVSMMEIALPAFPSEKKVHSLQQLTGWISEHADQMPTMACVDALRRAEKLMDVFTPQELMMFVDQSMPSLPALDNPSISINQIIAMQMAISSDCKALGNLTAHYCQASENLARLMPSE